MVNQKIIDYLKKQKKHGYDEEELRNMSIRHGFDKKEVNEALNHMNSPKIVQQPKKVEYPEPEPVQEQQPEPVSEKNPEDDLHDLKSEPSPKVHIPYKAIISAVVVLVIAGIGYAYFFVPFCGNGSIQPGESVQNCCLDIGCPGDQTCEQTGCADPICQECQYIENYVCVDYECCNDTACQGSMECENNVCVNITCGECEYLENNTCMKHECCSDDDCNETTVCIDNKCKTPGECGECEYLENNTCISYACCEDEDCDDDNASTDDRCLNPGELFSLCKNTQKPSCDRDSDCDDDNASTMDVCMGGIYCSSILITGCKNNDGYCPDSCEYDEDNDCEQEMVECTGINCFIDEAEDDCSPANLTYTFSTEDDGIIYDTEAYYELRGLEGDDCLFYTLYLDVDLTYTDDLIQEKLAQNMTQQEIDDEVDQLEDDYEDDYEDKDKLCEYPINQLVDVLRDMRDDDYMVPAYEEDNYDCTGSMYD
ncbi:hypothetical protein KY360_02410 [Candidatus Woesearchaeota archaeon]|nr:hypothetical protein [Candidatus Woesearchaeota archaeon]